MAQIKRSNSVASLKAYLQGDIFFDAAHPIGGGGCGDLFQGTHKDDGVVALKRLRHRGAHDSDAMSLVCNPDGGSCTRTNRDY